MIDIKAHIYSVLSNDEEIRTFVGDKIHPFSDDKDEMENYNESMPQITYARISAVTDIVGTRVEFFQVSAWSKTSAECEQIAMRIVEIFNRSYDHIYKKCLLQSMNDTYDREGKAYGIHSTFKFAIQDKNF